MSDLFCDETDLFVAGMAAGNHRVAIFSFYRYNPQLSFSQADWYDIDTDDTVKQEDIRKFMFQRSCKLLVHEINHLLIVT
jgi:archaemetzincin